MGHNRYQVFPSCGAQIFLVEILPGELPEYRLQNLAADLQPLESLRSWLKEKEAGKDTIAPIPLIRGKCYFHQADSGNRFAIRIGEKFNDYWQTTMPYLADVVLLPEHGDPASHLWQQAVGWGIIPPYFWGQMAIFDGDNVPLFKSFPTPAQAGVFSCPLCIDGKSAKGYIPPQVLANLKRSHADSKRTQEPDRIG